MTVPIARDQRRRVGVCAAHGLTIAAALDPPALAAATRSMLNDPARREMLRQRLGTLNLDNGVAASIAALERLVADQ